MTEGLARKGLFTRDSLEACDQSDFYDLIRNPNAPKKNRLVEQPKDSIENIQKKLEDEAQKQLLLNQSGMASQTFRLAAMAGKVVFMCFILPPYFLCYSFPKFILTGLVPKVFNLILWPFQKVRVAIEKKLHALKIRLERLVVFFNRLKLPFVRFNHFLKTIIPMVASFYRKGVLILVSPFRYMDLVARRLFNALNIGTKNLISIIKTAPAKILAKIKQVVLTQFIRIGNALDDYVVNPIADFFSPKVAALQALAGKLKRAVLHYLDIVQSMVVAFIKNPKQELMRYRRLIGEKVAGLARKISNSAVEWARVQINEFKLSFKAVRSKVYDLGSNRLFLAKKELFAWAAAIALAVRLLMTVLGKETARILQFLSNALKVPFRWIKSFQEKSGQQFRAFKRAVQGNLKQAVMSLLTVFQAILQPLKQRLIAFLEFVWGYLRRVPDALCVFMRKAFVVILKVVNKTILSMRVAIAYSKIISIYGMQLVREAAQEFIKTLSVWFHTR